MHNESKSTQQFDLERFAYNSWRLLRRTFWMVLAAAVLVGGLMGARSWTGYSPRYAARAVLSVRAGSNKMSDIIYTSSSADAGVTRQIINTFPTLIETDAMRERVLQELGTDYINGTITPKVIANSNIFTLTVTSSSPEDAYNVLQAVLKSYPEVASVVIGTATLESIEEPQLPTVPYNSRDFIHPALRWGLIAGLIVLALLCLLAQLRKDITSQDDMKKLTNIPCLAEVPHIEIKRRGSSHAKLSLQSDSVPPEFVESLRMLRTRVTRLMEKGGYHSLLITSAVPSEGKSTVAANLALGLAQSGKKVILVDADLRTQELHEFFGIQEKSTGLAELLKNGNDDAEPYLVQVPNSTLRVLCGNTVDKPQSLLRRKHLTAIFEKLQAHADVVIIDTPPIGLLADASVFAQCADAALFVVRAGGADTGSIADSLRAVSDGGTKLLGYAINGISTVTASRHRGYGYGYGYSKYGYGGKYGYGSKYGYGKKKETSRKSSRRSSERTHSHSHSHSHKESKES